METLDNTRDFGRDSDPSDEELSGKFGTRYQAFLETIVALRPRLHRYCARMTGSVLDGEDVVQEALFQAFRKLDTFDETRPLSAWLFRIAHNRCIDLLRRRKVRERAETEAAAPDWVGPIHSHGAAVGRAVEHLVLALPAKERACVLLKDVFDYTLEETAELVDSTVGGVKAALKRGRSKLAELAKLAKLPRQRSSSSRQAKNAEMSKLLHLYVGGFNRRDWNGLRELIAQDARLLVADKFAGRLDQSPYFGNYERWTAAWEMAAGSVDGEPVVVILRHDENGLMPISFVRIEVVDGRIQRVADYMHCSWLLAAAVSVVVEPS